jgi:ABC-2 type transport system permease protein
MDKLAAVIKREYLERVRNKWFVIVTVFGPVFFAAIMILPAFLTVRGIQGARVEEVRIVDATGTDLGMRFATHLAPPPRDSTPEARARADSLAVEFLASDEFEHAATSGPGLLGVGGRTSVGQHEARDA